ncbi:ABC transporter substrate-binding protein [Arcobacter sp. FWKO B]|uniref:ABC transporter substrate-binding protein n=1 Tax=Arcobacter sp. FWKO B TaxID=2593672 RepID=UPI0018A5F0E8|nr:ABC transporter substrate-binding protein [Arcobacter sp. FWKO B]QOG12591.1 ABC transporter substrate-binding protein [Arcobacter sp. FWKO B]
MKIVFFVLIIVSFLHSLTVKDMFNREVEIKNNEKIVAKGPGALRLISYMNMQDKLVGIEKLELDLDIKSPYRATLDKDKISSLPIIGEGGAGKLPNLEKLIEISPDIIFTSFLSQDQINLITQKTKIPVIALSYGSNYGGENNLQKLQAIKDSLQLIGIVMGDITRANLVVDFMSKQEKILSTLINTNQKCYIGAIGYKGARGITSTESHYPSFELLGINNSIKLSKNGHAQIALEELIIDNPDTIFLDLLGKKIVDDEIKDKSSLYQNLNAVKTNKVFWLYPYNFYNTNIENVYLNSFIIASHLGADIDIEAKKDEIYNIFLGQNSIKFKKHYLPKFEY